MMDLRPSAETIGMALDVMGVTLYALLAIWAAASRRHWFWRTCIVGAILLVVLVLPAHDLLIKFLIVQLIVVTGVTLWRWRRHRRRIANGVPVDPSTSSSGCWCDRRSPLWLCRIQTRTTASSCRRFVRELEQIEANREPLEQIERRTYIQRAHDSNWGSRAAQVVNELAGETWEEDFFRGRYRLSELDLRRVIVVAAVRAFTLEHDRLPDQLQDLVPEYLGGIPIDPFSTDSNPIQYELTEVGYRLTNEPADSQDMARKPLSVWAPPKVRP